MIIHEAARTGVSGAHLTPLLGRCRLFPSGPCQALMGVCYCQAVNESVRGLADGLIDISVEMD